MTLRLAVDRNAWLKHINYVATTVPGLAPVVKGNGYGFGMEPLIQIAATLSDTVCVGTIHEVAGIPRTTTVVVLTPTSRSEPQPPNVILTVGSFEHIEAAASERVCLKLRSSVNRFGFTLAELQEAERRCRLRGLDIAGYSIHRTPSSDDLDGVESWLPHLRPEVPLWLSRIDLSQPHKLLSAVGDRQIRHRVGTALWLGSKSFLQLSADVLSVHPLDLGSSAGYGHRVLTEDGALVVIGAGRCQGVGQVSDQSPFHWKRQRLALLERPHMQVSLCWVPSGQDPPAEGDWVDVGLPLTVSLVDEIVWIDADPRSLRG